MGDNYRGPLQLPNVLLYKLKNSCPRHKSLKKTRFDELHSSFREKASNQLSQFEKLRKSRANIGLRCRSKHKHIGSFWLNYTGWNTHVRGYHPHLISVCKRFSGYFKRSWKRNIIFVWLDSLVFQGVSKQMISSKATDVPSFTIFK